jgi:small subunit ribosomal protein S20
MPHSEHRKKTQRKANERNAVNRARRSSVRTAIKRERAAIGSGATTPQSAQETGKAIDKAAAYGVFHKNKAARLKSRLAKAVNKARASAKPAPK